MEDNFSEHVKLLLRNGISGNTLIASVARLSTYNMSPRAVALNLRFMGRTTSMKGVTFTRCDALELVYTDQRWHAGQSFISYCLDNKWQHRLELFLRKLGQPIIVSRHGASRDKNMLKMAFERAGILVNPVVTGCSSLARNNAFPSDVDETPSFLNVLQVTPALLNAAAK